ncbi:glycosyltransferase family 4 protein [Clavibacter capsici]|uniref:glycosyltransferase family 4 protein n=1 Tax=Clavibacter capsici TaxID=1874630 RepID=UPI00142804CF|nr:glycosyltransferase family 4 protein [Clavibacter capsici]QIS39201.1 glycosyltransferase family 4 protein [Clavibacter capsici]
MVVLEGNGDGHRFYYVRLLAEAIVAEGRRAVLVTRAGERDSPQAAEFLDGLPSGFSVVEVPRADVASATRVARSTGAHRIVIPDGDLHLVHLLTRRGRRLPHVTALVMREPVVGRGQAPEALARQAMKLATMTLAALRPSTRITVLKSSVWAGRSRFPVAQDPVTLAAGPQDVADVRAGWDLEPDRRWFAVVGAISSRKNLPLVAEAFARVAGDGTGLLVGGRIVEDQLAEAEPHLAEARRRGAHVVVVDRMLEDVELDAAIAAVDCVVLAHSNEGPSGILGKAVVSGTRLIVSGASSLRRDAQAIPDHATWTPLEVDALADAMEHAVAAVGPAPVPDMGTARFTSALL